MDTEAFFDFYFANAQVNGLMILDSKGTVLDVNDAFINNFGYSREEIKGQNFCILFTKLDNERARPQQELENVLTKGQSSDENFVIDNKGHAIWCTGESVLVKNKEGEAYIVKDIVNLQAKKQLHLFLTETDELLERVFESTRDIPILILDGGLKIQKANLAFLQLFELTEAPEPGTRLSDVDHSFWKESQVKDEIRNILVNNKALKQKDFSLTAKSGEEKTIRFTAKIIERQPSLGRKIFILLEDVTPVNES